ncbi:MAG: hypothetical protein IPF98_22995 [Gemmatimonadetes bacterium]|jgi:hypothetical protein|nr:hypothetical protein [Gemmatimonadota bacterium]
MVSRHPLREGVVAGFLGASAIAVWTFGVDALVDRAGVTAALLGAWIYHALGVGFGGRGFAIHVVTWLVTLYVGMMAIGTIVSAVYNRAERKPSFALALIVLVALFELILLNLTGLASRNPVFGGSAWLYGLVGNLLGALAMGRYLWRRHHPEAKWDWERSNDQHFHSGPSKA